MKRLEFADAARQDIHDIAVYTERTWGVAQRQRYMDEIRTALARLRDGTLPSRMRDDIRVGYRSVSVGRHVVFYRESDEVIVVLRLLHERMDMHRRLAEE
jgi:toxin ParE1/3/4